MLLTLTFPCSFFLQHNVYSPYPSIGIITIRDVTTALCFIPEKQKLLYFFFKNNKRTSRKLKNIKCFRFSIPDIRNIPEQWHVCSNNKTFLTDELHVSYSHITRFKELYFHHFTNIAR